MLRKIKEVDTFILNNIPDPKGYAPIEWVKKISQLVDEDDNYYPSDISQLRIPSIRSVHNYAIPAMNTEIWSMLQEAYFSKTNSLYEKYQNLVLALIIAMDLTDPHLEEKINTYDPNSYFLYEIYMFLYLLFADYPKFTYPFYKTLLYTAAYALRYFSKVFEKNYLRGGVIRDFAELFDGASYLLAVESENIDSEFGENTISISNYTPYRVNAQIDSDKRLLVKIYDKNNREIWTTKIYIPTKISRKIDLIAHRYNIPGNGEALTLIAISPPFKKVTIKTRYADGGVKKVEIPERIFREIEKYVKEKYGGLHSPNVFLAVPYLVEIGYGRFVHIKPSDKKDFLKALKIHNNLKIPCEIYVVKSKREFDLPFPGLSLPIRITAPHGEKSQNDAVVVHIYHLRS